MSLGRTEAIRIMRNHAVSLISGTNSIGGIAAETVRSEENLPRTTGVAARYFKSWRKSLQCEQRI